MLDNLTTPGQSRQDPPRPGPPDRRKHPGGPARSAHGPARGRRRPAGGQGLHRPRQGEGGRQEVLGSLTPGQALVGVVHDELTALMGGAHEGLNLATQPPAVMLMAGLQGAGKTTTTGKLGKMLHEQHEEEGAGGLHRRLSPGGHRPVADGGPAGRGRVLPVHDRPEAGRHRPSPRSTTRASTTWTCCWSTPPAGSPSTRP
jgi:hypothetical protein